MEYSILARQTLSLARPKITELKCSSGKQLRRSDGLKRTLMNIFKAQFMSSLMVLSRKLERISVFSKTKTQQLGQLTNAFAKI